VPDLLLPVEELKSPAFSREALRYRIILSENVISACKRIHDVISENRHAMEHSDFVACGPIPPKIYTLIHHSRASPRHQIALGCG
jgi:hypothetical protein